MSLLVPRPWDIMPDGGRADEEVMTCTEYPSCVNFRQETVLSGMCWQFGDILLVLVTLFFFLSLFSGWLNRRNKGQLPPLCCYCWFSFQAVFYTKQFLCCCMAAFWFGFVFQSACRSIETNSGIYKCCGSYENIIKHISNKAQQSILLFCYFSPPAIQMAIFISTAATVVLAEFYFKTSGCEDEMSSNICIRIAWKFHCYFQEILLKKNYCKWKFQNFNHYREQKNPKWMGR